MQISLLNASHNRKHFTCEEASLTNYLHQQASQDMKKRLATCFVAVNNDNDVIGYYTLSSESLGRDLIPERYLKKVPAHYNAPVILLGRLARHIDAKGTGLGEHLLLDALFRSYRLSSDSIGAMAIVVDPINDTATKFYKKYGFERLPDSGRMFLGMNVVKGLEFRVEGLGFRV